jgi:hypothetical protein
MEINNQQNYRNPYITFVFLIAILPFLRGCDSDSQELQTKTNRAQIQEISKPS